VPAVRAGRVRGYPAQESGIATTQRGRSGVPATAPYPRQAPL